MKVPREPILTSEKWRRNFFFRASHGRIYAPLCTAFGCVELELNPVFKILDSPLIAELTTKRKPVTCVLPRLKLARIAEEVLHCEGSCKKPLHRYCADISNHHYHKIIDELIPFVCLPCTQLLHEAELRTLQSEIEQLKSECRELRAELRAKAARDAAQAPPTRAGESASTQPAADFHALKKDVEQLQATVEALCSCTESRY